MRSNFDRKRDAVIRHKGFGPVNTHATINSFRFGNGALEKSEMAAEMAAKIPVGIGGKYGVIDAAIIGRCAPLLLGRPMLEKPEVPLDFRQHTMNLMDAVPMKVNSAGHLMIDLLEFHQLLL